MAKDIYDFAESMIRKNPNFQNNPEAQQVLQIIHNRDEKAGIELANKILGNAGVDQQTGIEKAMRFFGLNNN